MNKKLVISVTAMTILASTILLGCSANKDKLPTKNVIPTTQVQPDNSDKTNETGGSKASDPLVRADPISKFKYDISSIASSTKISFNTPWEVSPLKEFSGTIEGKGDKAQEEGYSHIIIKDEKSGKLTKLTLEDEQKNQLTAKDIEWIDESEMFVIIGFPNGTVSMGGKIYKVNVKTGETYLYTDTTSTKEEYTSVHKTSTGYTFNKHIYDDANLTKGHNESGILHSK